MCALCQFTDGGFHMLSMQCFPSTALKGKYLGLFQLYSNTYFTVSADLCVYSQFNSVGFTGSLHALMQLPDISGLVSRLLSARS